MKFKHLTAMFALILLVATAIPAAGQGVQSSDSNERQTPTQGPYVDPELATNLKSRGSARMFIYMKESADLSPAFGMDWEERGWFVYRTLKEVADRSQANIKAELDGLGADYRSFWIDNVIAVKNTDMNMLNALSKRGDVEALVQEPVGFIPDPEVAEEQKNQINAVIASVAQINAPDAWNLGYTGQGVTVGIIDSGTRYTHEALVNQYRGNLGGGVFDHNYNWFDDGGSTEPQYPNPHGTHVSGTAVGDDGGANQIGVAPGADWVSCLGCTSTTCPGTNLLACAQFMTAPTDLAGDNADPAQRPHVVNNSWGDCGQSYDGWYQGSVDAWIAAGVVPVSSNGNAINCGYSEPPGPNTVGNPARYGSMLGIGSTGNANGQYAPHSNWGPTDDPNDGTDPTLPDPNGFNDLKPNVSAPGVSICSAYSTGDANYTCGFTGTSMSSPAATGVIALMISAAPSLAGDYAKLGTILMETATPVPYDSGVGGEGPGNVPNYATGWGEIDALAAVQAAAALEGPQGELAGTVFDNSSGLPIAGADVSVTNPNPPPADWSASTDESGEFAFTISEGTFDVDVSAYGYQAATEAGVTIVDGQTTDIQVSLVPAATYQVSGVVTDSGTGWPLHAEIEIDGYPNSPIYTDPSDGSYSVTLPEGMAFDFTVTALSGGYDFATRTVGPLTGAQVEDFGLDADLVTCDAPGYGSPVATVLSETFDATSVPTGWTIEDYEGTGQVWSFDDPGTRTNLTGGAGNFAIVDSDNYGSAGAQDTGMVTSAVDLSTAANAELTFNYDFRNIGATAEVDVSTDGGTSWTTEWSLAAASRGPATASVGLIDYVGQSNVQLRFRYSEASWDWWWQVDNVEVTEFGNCAAFTGELVNGRVTDANDGSALIGATVSVDGTGQSTTTGSSLDPDFGDGAYTLFVPEGAQTITVTEDGYEDGTLSDTFVDGNARRADFALNAGRLSAQPESLSETVTFGQSEDGFLVLVNDGTAQATVQVNASSVQETEDFESTFPPAGWSVNNLGGNCDWQRNDALGVDNLAGGDGFSAVASSDDCGLGTTMDTALVSLPFDVDVVSELRFVLAYDDLGSSDSLEVDISTDGGTSWTNLETYTSDVAPTGGAEQAISLGAYDGSVAQVRFRYIAGWDWYAQIDQVRITGEPDWLTLTPDNGTFADGPITFFETLNVTPTFNAGAASITEPGTYLGSVVVDNDTPYGTIEVPVEMVVEPTVDQARIAGTISSLGYCDGEQVELDGADVEIVGGTNTFNVTSDAAGDYELWLDIAEAPLTLTVSAPGHEDRVLSGVPLTSQSTTTRDIELRTSTPCASSSPASLSSSILPDTTDTLSVTVTNDGAGPLNWNESSTGVNVTLIDQVDNGNDGIVSDRFSGLAGATGAYSADDFSVNGEGLVELTADGFNGSGSGIETFATEIGFFLYPDAGGAPAGHPEDGGGSEAFSYVAGPGDSAITIVDDSLTLDVSAVNGGAPLSLPAGDYWLVAYTTVPGTEGDPRWNWYAATTAEGSTPQIITPGAAFGGAFPDWTALTGAVDPIFTGLAMNVEGFVECGASWITSVNPASGSVSADSSSDIDVTVDSTGLSPGDYQGNVCLQTDDANNNVLIVPVTLTVEAPASFATVEGSVMSLGYCDENIQPADGAAVTIDGALSTYNVSTDSNGDYSISIDSAETPVDVSVAYAGHVGSSVNGVTLSSGTTSTVDFDLDLDAACAQADPMSLGSVMMPGMQESEALTLYNYGVQSYDWTLEFDGINGINGTNGTTDVVVDGGFEGGTPNADWDEASDAFGTPLCDEASCGTGGGTGANSGDWWVWFGGLDETVETGSVSQAVTIPSGPSAQLSFFLEIPAADVSGSMEVTLNGDLLFSVTEADAGTYATYQEVTVDVSSYADGGTYDLEFFGATNSTTVDAVTNFFVDDVSLEVMPAGNCSNPQAVSWASLDTTSGTVAAGSNAPVNVTYDSTGLTTGTYMASLCFDTTDTQAGDSGLIVIPVTLEVSEDDIFSDRFEGTVITGDDDDPSRFLRKRPE